MGDTDSQTFEAKANKDGTIVIKDTEGKEIRYAKEADLLAIKGGAEASKQKIEEITTAHKVEVESLNTKVSEANAKALQAEAAKEQLEERIKESAGSKEELAGVKTKLDAATKAAEAAGTKLLELRGRLVVATYGISAEAVKGKTIEQLDALEEALKAVQGGKKIGPYAAPGGSVGATVESDLDRANRIIKEAEAKQKAVA